VLGSDLIAGAQFRTMASSTASMSVPGTDHSQQ
jgi:hypothetical protein